MPEGSRKTGLVDQLGYGIGTVVAHKFDHLELTRLMVRERGVHEGHWTINFAFVQRAVNVDCGEKAGGIMPTAMTHIMSVGIQRVDAPGPMTVDAALVNPLH